MKRLYIAGAYNADNVIGVLDNMRQGMRAATKAFLAGFSPFTPWHDFHHQLMLYDGEQLTIDDYYRFSIAWLAVSDGMLLVPGFEKSKGTAKEIEYAEAHGIPVFFFLDDAIEYFAKQRITTVSQYV